MRTFTALEIFCVGLVMLVVVAQGNRNEFPAYNLLRSTRDLGALDGIHAEHDVIDGFAAPEMLPIPQAQTSGGPNSSLDIFRQLLPPGYNMHIIPKHRSGRPMDVYIKLKIRKVLTLDEPNESIKNDIELRVLWTDYKIRDNFNEQKKKFGMKPISYDELTPEDKKKYTIRVNDPAVLDLIWKPNLFIGSLLQVTQPYAMAKPVVLKVIPDIGLFEYLSRITVTTDCPMNFHYYPADTQDCHFSIRSFSYLDTDLRLKWFESGVWLHELETASFNIAVSELGNYTRIEDDEDPVSGYFDIFDFHIKARRRLSYHVVQTFLPSTFYIVITCLCFLLPSRFVEARIGIAMTTLLTLTAMFASVRESTPQVSYVKAIDTWMAACIMFVFLTLAVFTFITWLSSVQQNYQECQAKKTDGDENGVEMEVMIEGQNKSKPSGGWTPKSVQRSEKIMTFLEKYNFAIFLSILVIFSIWYWLWLLFTADYFEWKVDKRYNNIRGDPW